VTIDTTVQTKAVAHPTDSHLLHTGVRWLPASPAGTAWRCASPSCGWPPRPGARRRG
jgi:hypothetical protein